MKNNPILQTLLFALALCPACLSAPAATPQKDVTLAEVLAKHSLASLVPGKHAPDGDQQIVYAIAAGGLTGTLTEFDSPPKKYRVDLELGAIVHEVDADNGTTAWQQDTSGNVRIVRGPELKETRATQTFSLETFDPLRNGTKDQAKLNPKRDPATGDYIVDATPADGALQTFYINPKTYLIDKLIAHQGEIATTVTMLAYKPVGSAYIPSVMDISYNGVPLVIHTELKSAELNRKFNPAFFNAPQAVKDYAFLGQGDEHSVTVPFTFENYEISVPVTINGQNLRFMVDSGAASSFITSKAADQLKLATQGNIAGFGYGGTAATSIAANVDIQIPDAIDMKGQTLYVINDDKIAQNFKDQLNVDGALGYDLFARFIVKIDYANKTLTLSDPQSDPVISSGRGVRTLPIKLVNHTPTVTATLDGKPNGQFLVDTGDAGAVHLNTQYAASNGLLNTKNSPGAIVQTGLGVGGNIDQILTPNHTLAIAGTQIPGVPVATIPGAGLTDVSELAGGIGNWILSRYTVTFNYPGLQFSLEPPQKSLAAAGAPLMFVTTEVPVPIAPPAAPPAPPAQQAPESTDQSAELKELLARHLEALGGLDALEAIHNTRITATIETGGTTGKVITVFAMPGKEYEDDQLGVLDIQQGFDGTASWRRDSNGNVRALAGDELLNLKNQLFFDTNSYVLPGRMTGTMTLRPARDPKTNSYIVDVTPDGGKHAVLYFEPRTYLIIKEIHNDDDVETTTTYGGYKSFDGVMFPTEQSVTTGNERYDVSLVATKVENNIDVPDSLFETPAVTRSSGFIKPGATSATVPFNFDDGEIGMNVTLNGHPEFLFLDSGASGLALDAKVANGLNLKQGGYLEARGYGGSQDLRPVTINSLEVGNAIRMTNFTAEAVPLPDSLSEFLSRPVAGFIGYDILSRFVIRIDYDKKLITFIDPSSFKPEAADGPPVPIELNDDIPAITAHMDDFAPERYIVDSGDAAILRLYGPYVAKNHLTQLYPGGINTIGGGIGGLSAARLTRVKSFSIGDATLKGVPTDFSLDEKGGASELNAGSIGSGLLAHFIVTFDYPHSRIFFAVDPNTNKPFDSRTIGLAVMTPADKSGKTHYYVAAIQDGSPLNTQNLSTEDELISIDGKPTSAMNPAQVRQILGTYNSRGYLTLGFKSVRGKRRTIRASFYDALK